MSVLPCQPPLFYSHVIGKPACRPLRGDRGQAKHSGKIMMKIAIGSDHGGVKLKGEIIRHLESRGVTIDDAGSLDPDLSVDYGTYARTVAEMVIEGRAESGILICTTGIGMSIAANRFSGIRAALCRDAKTVATSRDHNNANILILAGKDKYDGQVLSDMLDAWCRTDFSGDARHIRRLDRLEDNSGHTVEISHLALADQEIYSLLKSQAEKENDTLNLIASENTVSRAVRVAQGCVMTNKYAEGYPGKRWYNGCSQVDRLEQLAMDRARELFGADHANVQPHCGSSANMAVYFSILQPGDTILAMSLDHGGHLTHGSPVNFSGGLYKVVSYGVSREQEVIDYDALESLALECRPKLIVAGASAYPRILDFARFREIADRTGAMLMVDMAHIAGLVAGGAHPNPTPYADFVTTTTHKTLRGPRGGMILCSAEHSRRIDKTIFPGIQGGPLMHSIAAKAVCLREAAGPEFKAYARQVVSNAAALAGSMSALGFRLVSGGTDNHLLMVNLEQNGITGKDAADALEKVGLVCNKNAVPFDSRSPFVTSGIRLGTAAVTTRGLKEKHMESLAGWIKQALADFDNPQNLEQVREQVVACAREFPLA